MFSGFSINILHDDFVWQFHICAEVIQQLSTPSVLPGEAGRQKPQRLKRAKYDPENVCIIVTVSGIINQNQFNADYVCRLCSDILIFYPKDPPKKTVQGPCCIYVWSYLAGIKYNVKKEIFLYSPGYLKYLIMYYHLHFSYIIAFWFLNQ